MGGRPLFALNLVAWPARRAAGVDCWREVLAGGAEIGAEGGFAVVGGHSVDDPEPKYGLAVVGEVHPDRILTNAGLRDGRRAGAHQGPRASGSPPPRSRRRRDAAGGRRRPRSPSMTRSTPPRPRRRWPPAPPAAPTSPGSGCSGTWRRWRPRPASTWTLDVAAVPFLPGVRDLAAAGHDPRRHPAQPGLGGPAAWTRAAFPELEVLLLADAQTSGGLLFGAAPDRAAEAVAQLGAPAAVIGRVRTGTGRITLR